MNKPANRVCIHQASTALHTHKGCAVYGTAQMPNDCRVWNCRWIVNDDTAELERPEKSHYVIDIVPDFIRIGEGDDPQTRIPVIQIWCDPNHRDAHRDPALRRYLERRAREGFAALIRYSSREGLALFAPVFDADKSGQWHELPSNMDAEPGHKPSEIIKVLQETGAGRKRQ